MKALRVSLLLLVLTLEPLLIGPACGPGGPFPLTLAVTGIGTGRIDSDFSGFNCTASQGQCTQSIPAGTLVTLQAVADTGFYFLGWTGGVCRGGGPCEITLDQAETVGAAFVPLVFDSTLNINGTDSGNFIFNIWTVMTDGSDPSPLTSVTGIGAVAIEPNWSPDGEKVVFNSDQALDGSGAENLNGTFNIWVVNGDGSNPLALTQVTADTADTDSPQWSPDGSQILFSSSQALDGSNAANANVACNVWVVGADGSNPRPLTTLTAAGLDVCPSPQWSPDGSKILYDSSRALDQSNAANANSTSNIWVMNADGTGNQALTQYTAAGADNNGPRWSTDGNRIVYVSAAALDGSPATNLNGTTNIWVMAADGSGAQALTLLTAADADSFDPAFSPDGATMAYSSSRAVNGTDNGSSPLNFNIWIMNSDGSSNTPITVLTNELPTFGAFFPFWIPDGSAIFFSSSGALDGSNAQNTNEASNIWMAGPQGQSPVPITSFVGAGGIVIFL